MQSFQAKLKTKQLTKMIMNDRRMTYENYCFHVTTSSSSSLTLIELKSQFFTPRKVKYYSSKFKVNFKYIKTLI